MSPQLKVGDRVRTATALNASHWTENQLTLRIPDAGGIIAHRYPAGISPGCCVCAQHSCYEVQHDRGYAAFYHGDELTLITQAEPKPDDEPDGGRLGERVEAVEATIRQLEGKLRVETLSAAVELLLDRRGRVAALEQPPAPIHDDSSLDPPRPVARCERCGGRPEQHPGEPTCHELLQLWRRLNESGAYTVSDPAALAEAALRDRETVCLQMRELTATKLQYGAMHDELSGIHQQLLEAVDGEPDATTDALLARVLRRAGIVQHLIMTRDPRLLRKMAEGLMGFAGEDGFVATIAALLNAVAAIAEEERD